MQTSLVREEVNQIANMKNSAEGKMKGRRFSRAAKSESVKELWVLSDGIFGLGCCEEMIMSFS